MSTREQREKHVPRWLALAGILVLLSSSWMVLAGELGIGFEFGIGHQPVASSNTLGEIMVVWEGAGTGIHGQTFNPSGEQISAPFNVTDRPSDSRPDVVWISDDQVAIAWQREDEMTKAASSSVIVSRYGRPVGSGSLSVFTERVGRPVGSQYRIPGAADPAVASDEEGNYVVTWTELPSGKHMSRFFMSDGTPATEELAVGRPGAATPTDVAMLPTSETLVVWENASGNIAAALMAGRVRPVGSEFRVRPVGSEFQVNDTRIGFQTLPAVTTDLAGHFNIVWERRYVDGTSDIYGRRVDANGQKLGEEYRVTEDLHKGTAVNTAPSVAADITGNLMVIWRRGDAIMARPLSLDGPPSAAEFRVDMGDVAPENARIAPTTGGSDFVVLWDGKDHGRIRGRFLVGPFARD